MLHNETRQLGKPPSVRGCNVLDPPAKITTSKGIIVVVAGDGSVTEAIVEDARLAAPLFYLDDIDAVTGSAWMCWGC